VTGHDRPSVVIPAHDAADTIAACLRSIRAEGDFAVVVVCNGCRDATASIARSVGGAVRVVELPDADKAAALNVGDRAVDSFPRIYVDADVVFAPGALRALVAAIDGGAPAAAPHATIDTRHAGRTVRSYYAIWHRLGVVDTGLCGAGVYALSAGGRARFGDFPDLIADDLFVDQRFGLHERVTVRPGVTYAAPATLRELLTRKTRVFAGNLQLARRGPACHPARQPGDRWFHVVAHDPRLVAHAPAYVAVSVVAKLRARVAMLRAEPRWTGR
jgi:glycosyltransferase involved in cell wall biosynthesis